MINSLIWLISLGHTVVDLCQGILSILMPRLAENFNLSYFQVGLISMAFTLSSAIAQPLFGALSDRFSIPWLIPAGLILSGIGLSLTGLVPSYNWLLFVVLMCGLGVAIYHPEGSKLTNRCSPRRQKSLGMAIFSSGGNLGLGIGPALAIFILGIGGLRSTWGLVFPGLLIALPFLFLMPGIKCVTNDNGGPTTLKVQINKVKKTNLLSLLLLLLYITVRSWIQSVMLSYLPFYFTQVKGGSEDYAGGVLSLYLVAGAVGTVIGGPIADRWGPRSLFIGSMAVALFTTAPFLWTEGWPVFVFAALSGAGLAANFGPGVVFGQYLMPHNLGLASGLTLGFSVGMGSIGVAVLGVVADRWGLVAAMGIICLLPVVAIATSLLLPDVKGTTVSGEGE
ncbi:MFS transporter [Desulfotruncus alcoholivorax]|uniref:MFS transporter n=1 Tax=Desulfotruncus alcoholivorax TaxID=265477 RepID=UPI0004184177|nr:MFS transporter [Desulfotruncus alcoholivorax]